MLDDREETMPRDGRGLLHKSVSWIVAQEMVEDCALLQFWLLLMAKKNQEKLILMAKKHQRSPYQESLTI